ncbi:MAG TPA: DMT family transporter [Microvirga sp.]|jgi:drug/metabolite transporter (DMT)-like permease
MTTTRKVTALLLANGFVLATHTLLARQAHAFGVAPILYALASAAGAAAFLLVFRTARQGWAPLRRAELIYAAIAGLVSIALPQTLIYSASAYVSAGIASLAYAFPTPLTYLLAALVGLERMSAGRTLGVGIAFAGAVFLAVSRSTNLAGDGIWVLLAMLAPLSIAAGNIYRARFWPEGSNPLDLALAMSGMGALWLLAALLATGSAPAGGLSGAGLAILCAASAVAAVGNVIYFELQRSGGIVSFSQIGYVGAVLGLVGGSLLLGERYALATWIAAAVIALGVAVSEILKPRAR